MQTIQRNNLQEAEFDHIVRHLYDCRSVKWTAKHCNVAYSTVTEIQKELGEFLPDPEVLFLTPIQLRVAALDLEPENEEYDKNWQEYERMLKLATPLLKNRAIIKAAEARAQQELPTLQFAQMIAAQRPELYAADVPALEAGDVDAS